MKLKSLKSISGAVMLLLISLITSCSSGPRTVENPWINFANTSTIDIDRVELTDSATILTVKATYYPNYWIKIAPSTHLTADGKDYAMIKAEGIELGKEFWMPESGKAEFKLYFQPLPFNTKSFDFIEGEEEGAFHLWAIDITGKKPAQYPEGVPAELKKEPKNVTIPDPAFEIGKTTVNFRLCPYRPELGSDFSLIVNTLSGEQQEYTLKFDNQGKATLSFDQYGTATAFVVGPYGGLFTQLTLFPGETMDAYIDTRLSGSLAMSSNRDIPADIYKRSLHNGKYSDYDRATLKGTNIKNYRLDIYSGQFADYHMTGEQYKDYVKKRYEAAADSINKADMPQVEKDFHMLGLQNDVLMVMADYRNMLARNYHSVKDDWEKPIPADSIKAHLSDEDFKDVTGWFDVANPKLLLVGQELGIKNWNQFGVPGDLSKSMAMYQEMARKAKQQKLTDADLDSLKSLSNPFFAAACDSIVAAAERAALELRKTGLVMPTPEVADDKLFDAIIAPYKGKVVMVDLWNTWCGPCRGALKQNEPLKTGELANDDIVWLYIADESSDASIYLDMVPNIKGVHFKVNERQIKAIRDRFKVDGIPYYILVDRQGKAEGRPDLRDHSRYVEAIKSKL